MNSTLLLLLLLHLKVRLAHQRGLLAPQLLRGDPRDVDQAGAVGVAEAALRGFFL